MHAAACGDAGGEILSQLFGAVAGTDQRAERADHADDLGDAALVEGMDVDAALMSVAAISA